MISTNMYKSLLSSQGRNLGEIKKNQSDRNINVSFTRDPEYKKVYILTKNGWKWEEVKYSRHAKESITADAQDYYIQFRPKTHYPIGSYIIIPDDTDPEINLKPHELQNPFLQPISERTQWWFIVKRDETNYVRYEVLKCNWNFKWVWNGKIRECFGAIRNANSYTSCNTFLRYTQLAA